MIDTVNTKAAHYVDGGYTVGSGDRVIVVLGSCRIFPFVNYLDRWNRSQSPEPFTIFAIYVVNFKGMMVYLFLFGTVGAGMQK